MECIDCVYSTAKIANWQRHIASKKHAENTGSSCPCGKFYRSKPSLKRHQAKCTSKEQRIADLEQMLRDKDAETERKLRDIIQEQQTILLQQTEVIRDIKNDMSKPRVVNNTQNNFNLQIFLNETCRDAPTLDQFIQCIPIALSGDESIGDIFVKSLSKCALEKRPIHCTDVKRGKLAVKYTEDEWEQDAGKIDPLLAQNVNKLRERYMRHLSSVWCLEHPRYMSNEKENDEWTQFLSMISEEVDAKFIAHISKATSIPKS